MWTSTRFSWKCNCAQVGRQEIDWLPPEDVAGLVAHPGGVTPSNRPRIAGIPLPSGDKKTDKLAEILRPLTLDADVVPPMGALHGFLYFNVNNECRWRIRRCFMCRTRR